jgi:hypothetical protein
VQRNAHTQRNATQRNATQRNATQRNATQQKEKKKKAGAHALPGKAQGKKHDEKQAQRCRRGDGISYA